MAIIIANIYIPFNLSVKKNNVANLNCTEGIKNFRHDPSEHILLNCVELYRSIERFGIEAIIFVYSMPCKWHTYTVWHEVSCSKVDAVLRSSWWHYHRRGRWRRLIHDAYKYMDMA